MKALEISLLSSPYTTVKLKWTGLPYRSYSFLCLHIVSLNKFEDLIWHTVVFNLVPRALFPEVEQYLASSMPNFSFFGVLTGQKGFQRGELPENYKMLLNKTTTRYFRGYKIKIQSPIEKQKSNTFPVATQCWMTCKL